MANHLKKHSGGHGYTDQDNPFGDSKVNERFVWGKKIEKQIQSGVDLKDLTAKAEKRKQDERLVSYISRCSDMLHHAQLDQHAAMLIGLNLQCFDFCTTYVYALSCSCSVICAFNARTSFQHQGTILHA